MHSILAPDSSELSLKNITDITAYHQISQKISDHSNSH